ncbi:hypothetical protein KEM55_006333, partial [Ascosphaera atra]
MDKPASSTAAASVVLGPYLDSPTAPVDVPLPSVEVCEEQELAAGTEADEGGCDDESDDDEAAS